MKTKKGPNDARRVGWALGVFFVLFFSVLLTTHYVRPFFGPDGAHQSQRRPTQAYKDKKGPKRRQTRRLGPRCVFCSFFLRFIDNSVRQTILWPGRRPPKPTKANAGLQRQKRAQTTPDTSVGP